MTGSDDLVARLRHKSNMELIVTPADVALAERALASRDKEIERLTDLDAQRTVQVIELMTRAETAEALAATATRERDEARAECERLRAALEPFGRAAKAMPKDDPGPFPLYSMTGYRQISRADLDAVRNALHPEGGEHGK